VCPKSLKKRLTVSFGTTAYLSAKEVIDFPVEGKMKHSQ